MIVCNVMRDLNATYKQGGLRLVEGGRVEKTEREECANGSVWISQTKG